MALRLAWASGAWNSAVSPLQALVARTGEQASHRDPAGCPPKMAIYTWKMDISITEFKNRCLEIVRRVEETGTPITIRRRGKAVA